MRSIDLNQLHDLSREAAIHPRRRCNLNLHPELADPVQRFCNAMEPGTYVRPHRHTDPARWELFVLLAGRVATLTFDDDGRVLERIELAMDGVRVLEVPVGAWHALAALEPGSILFEVKQGPYCALSDKDFATWAPTEGGPGAAELEGWYRTARPGERAPSV